MTVRSRFALLAAAGLVLAGCGSVHSGSAAVVNGERISMSEADEAAEGLCALAAQNAAAQGAASIPGADVRRQALSTLILEAVAERVAERDDITITTPELSSTQVEQARQLFGDETDLVVATIKRNQRALAVAAELARRELGAEADAATQQELEQQGQQLLFAEAERLSVDIDPRFAMEGVADVVAPSGSLSVAGPAVESQTQPDVLNCTT